MAQVRVPAFLSATVTSPLSAKIFFRIYLRREVSGVCPVFSLTGPTEYPMTNFRIKILPTKSIKPPEPPLWVESPQDRLQQAKAVARDGFNERPVLVDENAVLVGCAATYRA